MTLLGFGRDHLREAAVSHQCNGGRRFSLRMKPHQPNGEVRGRQGASTVTGMVQDDESCRCTCRASFFSTSAPVSPSHRIARNPSFRARTAGLRRTRRLTLIMATPKGFQSLWTAMWERAMKLDGDWLFLREWFLTLVTNGANSELSAMHAREQEYQNETVLCCYQSIHILWRAAKWIHRRLLLHKLYAENFGF